MDFYPIKFGNPDLCTVYLQYQITQQINKMKLTEEIKETIQRTPDLYAKVCNELGKAPATLYQILKKDDSRLLQINVLNAIKEFTGLTESEILESEATATA